MNPSTGATGFAAAVYTLVARVPRGRLTTYGLLACALGRPGAARAVGRCLSRNPFPLTVPCHRVVCADGRPGGYRGGGPGRTGRKLALLAREGLAPAGEGAAARFALGGDVLFDPRHEAPAPGRRP